VQRRVIVRGFERSFHAAQSTTVSPAGVRVLSDRLLDKAPLVIAVAYWAAWRRGGYCTRFGSSLPGLQGCRKLPLPVVGSLPHVVNSSRTNQRASAMIVTKGTNTSK